MREQEIFDKLFPLIREVTGAKPERISMRSGLMEDLGAESLDLLDLTFLIEEEFGVVIEANEFERRASARLNGAPYEKNGLLTDEALAELRRALPDIPPEKLSHPLPKQALPRLLNVAVFVHLIERKLALAEEESRHAS
jgi:acyl carrier protein